MSGEAQLPENELIGNILHDAEEYGGENQGLNVFGVQQINGPVILDRSLSSASRGIGLQERGLQVVDDGTCGRGCFLNLPPYYVSKQYGGDVGQYSSLHPLDVPNPNSLFYSMDMEGLGWGLNEYGYAAATQKPSASFHRPVSMREQIQTGYTEVQQVDGSIIDGCVAPLHGGSMRDSSDLSSYIQSNNISAPEYSNGTFHGPHYVRGGCHRHYDKYGYRSAVSGGTESNDREDKVEASLSYVPYQLSYRQPKRAPSQPVNQDADIDGIRCGTMRAPPEDMGVTFRNCSHLPVQSQYGYYTILDRSGQIDCAGLPHPHNYSLVQQDHSVDSPDNAVDCSSLIAIKDQDFRSTQYANSYNVPLKTVPGYLHEPPLLYLLSNPGQHCLLPGDSRASRDYTNHPASIRTSMSDGDTKYIQSASYGLSAPGSQSRLSPFSSKNGFDHSSPSKSGPPVRSSLLEEFRNIKGNRKFDLKDAVDHFVEFSGDQYGSRFIQQKLEVATNEEKQMVFQEIFPVALQLMTDVFGNYVIQKFFEYGTNEQKKSLGDALEGNVLNLSLQMYGCRVVQKAFEVISVEQQAKLVRELNGFVLKCIKDQNGNHVIQKVIEQVPVDHILFVVDTFKGKVCSLAMHPYGCRVIQRILEHCSLSSPSNDSSSHPDKDSSSQLDILDELLKETSKLVQDQYGNYVVQHVLENGRQKDRKAIISHLEGKIVALSQHKFASNVIEKCVQYGSYDDRQMILQEIVSEKPVQNGNYLPLEIMMKDAYANYVVQKILEVCDNNQRNLLVLKIKPHLASLKKYTYAKHIIARLEKILGKPL